MIKLNAEIEESFPIEYLGCFSFESTKLSLFLREYSYNLLRTLMLILINNTITTVTAVTVLLQVLFMLWKYEMFRLHAAVQVLTCELTAVVVRMLVSPVSTVVDLITHLPLTDTASVPTLELIRGTWRTLCGEIWWSEHQQTVFFTAEFIPLKYLWLYLTPLSNLCGR